MIHSSVVFGLITARGGSKGVPRKNIREVAGRPLVAWTIDVALACPELEHVYLSTDDDEIESVAKDFGIKDVIRRGAELAADDTPHFPVLEHALGSWAENDRSPTHVVLLQPTSPLRTSEDIESAIRLSLAKEADEVVSVTQVTHHHPYLVRTMDKQGLLTRFLKESSIERRQDLPAAFAPNGAVYVYRRESFGKADPQAYGYVMPPERSLDVDSEFDLILADLLLRHRPQ